MKLISFILLLLFTSCVYGKKLYLGSTPANSNVVRSFLGISLTDSIDFIKWKITLGDDIYSLECRYGIGKPNTDGFIDEKKVELNGSWKKQDDYYSLKSANKTLMMLEINADLLHLLNSDKQLLNGTSGWSYTLSSDKPVNAHQANIFSKQNILKDSMAFGGRTPCHEFGLIHAGNSCLRMKWYVILYADAKTNSPTTYHLNGNSRREGGIKGKWKIVHGKGGRIIYQLNSNGESYSIYLLKLDENILVFTDVAGNLLVGNKNFSFTLNRRW